MAIRNLLKRKSEDKKSVTKKAEKALTPGSIRIDQSAEGGERYARAILKPRITEKASFITEDGAYTFDVDPRANKSEIKKAFKEMYKVTPKKIRIITIPAKQMFARNRQGSTSGGKKAIVFLKEGERIEFV